MRRTPEQAALLTRGMAGPLTPVERVLDVLALAAIVACWLLPLLNLSSLPEQVPTHFDSSGRPDAYGSRISVFLFAGVATAVWAVLVLTRRNGRLVNLPVPVTEENHRPVGALVRTFLTVVGTVTTLMLTALQVQTIRAAFGNTDGLGEWFGPAVIGVYLALLLGFLVASGRHHPLRGRAARGG